MATEKMTLEAAKQIIVKHLPDDFLKDDKNREALSLMGTAFEQFKVLTDENLRLIQESEKQQAEIERLQEELKTKNGVVLEIFENKSAWERIARIKAIKEFAERLKEKNFCFGSLRGVELVSIYAVELKDIDNLVKEMTEPSLLDKKFEGEQE